MVRSLKLKDEKTIEKVYRWVSEQDSVFFTGRPACVADIPEEIIEEIEHDRSIDS